MSGYILSGIVLMGFLYVCFEQAQDCVSSDDWKVWAKTSASLFIFLAGVFMAGALVAVQR